MDFEPYFDRAAREVLTGTAAGLVAARFAANHNFAILALFALFLIIMVGLFHYLLGEKEEIMAKIAPSQEEKEETRKQYDWDEGRAS